mmetsp:Transcript_53422/g.134210  ORF Transcript_53422/g.134210 Transcript_53422/m.134210 type:complete len:423 (+) Transcript_53422:185-1453(+)
MRRTVHLSARLASVRRASSAASAASHKPPSDVSVYVHWPFCTAICPYCDFNRYLDRDVDHSAMCASLLRQINAFVGPRGLLPGRAVKSIFFGGGTPSLAKPSTIAAVISHVRSVAGTTTDDLEVTMEMNPTSVEIQRLEEFAHAGVNRVSIGVQSLIDADLSYLGRRHTAKEAVHAVELACRIFPYVSLDLIYARHRQQTVQSWRQELQAALALGTRHMSLYQLTLHPGTSFHRRSQSQGGGVALPLSDSIADMYEVNIEECSRMGLQQYEVSNFAVPGEESRHNLQYWSAGDYIGVGPGAEGCFTDNAGTTWHTRAIRKPAPWLASLADGGLGLDMHESVPMDDILSNALIAAMRTLKGLPHGRFLQLSRGRSMHEVLDMDFVQRAQAGGLIVLDAAGLRPTQRGLAVADAILRDLTPARS